MYLMFHCPCDFAHAMQFQPGHLGMCALSWTSSLPVGDSYPFLQKERVAEVRLQSQREAFESCSQGLTPASEAH